ncbi:PIN domain-like protein [Lichtheimia hyalospora FSU 10163]|nr:PIN domain-like protein [Lichtheimia hyalospora FSU 10163]
MGIYGLAAFVHEHSTLGDQKTWSIGDAVNPTTEHFIVDGNAFTYHYAMQSRADWIHGGQYSVVAKAIQEDVLVLQRAGIQMTVLFDGAVPHDKQPTRLRRYASYIERASMTLSNLDNINSALRQSKLGDDLPIPSDFFLLPPLMLDVCVQALREMHVEIIVCADEADGQVATLAQVRNGYVVSKDSDMHVYPHAGKGYIPLGSLNIGNDMISATAYHPKSLASLLDLNIELLPLFGTLLGNDYLDTKLVREPITGWCSSRGFQCKSKTIYWPKIVAEFLRRTLGKQDLDSNTIKLVLKELNSMIKGKGVDQQVVMESVRRYNAESVLLDRHCASAHDNMKHTSRAIADITLTHTFWSPIFLEDLQEPSSWLVSRRLRQHVYTALLKSTLPIIREYIREKRHLTQDMVECSVTCSGDGFTQLAQLHHTDPAILAELDRYWWPLVLCLRCLIYDLVHHHGNNNNSNRIKNHEVIGLLAGGFVSLLHNKDGPSALSKLPTIKKRALHLTAQFQSIIFCSHLLGQALNVRHLEQEGILIHMYDGAHMHHYLQMARRGANVERMLGPKLGDKHQLFWNLYRAVIAKMEQNVETIFDYKVPPTWSKGATVKGKASSLTKNVKKRSGNNHPHATSATPGKVKRVATDRPTTIPSKGANIFNVLAFGCSFDDDDE